jgi:hypothetical protein
MLPSIINQDLMKRQAWVTKLFLSGWNLTSAGQPAHLEVNTRKKASFDNEQKKSCRLTFIHRGLYEYS